MIIGTFKKLEVGKIITDMYIDNIENNGIKNYQPFMVLRIATKQEYIDYYRSNGCDYPIELIPEEGNFYEISVD